ncbi:hypothetical protein L3i20_v205560 [Paenibacillus sp. L3-i20]|nr:hypothetical protein L3i20_v205560 [Paenibacillus sp. L3-i20]
MLEVGASGAYGYISKDMERQSSERLVKFGLKAGSIRYEYSTTSGVDPTIRSAPVSRGTGISLSISYPYENLFVIDSLIGITPVSADASMRAYGMKMSEYVP